MNVWVTHPISDLEEDSAIPALKSPRGLPRWQNTKVLYVILKDPLLSINHSKQILDLILKFDLIKKANNSLLS